MDRLRAATGWESAAPVSLEIKTLPADADPYALRIARSVARWFGAAGLEVSVTPVAVEELYRQVLLKNDFDVFVSRLLARVRDGSGLYALLHSRFGSEPGWQNPFGYANLDVDGRLVDQLTASGADGREALAAVQRGVARTQPFSLAAVPDDIRAVRREPFTGWSRIDYESPSRYLSIEEGAESGGSGEAASGGRETLRLAVTDRRPTENLNPLAAEFRRFGVLTGLLYDPLGYETRSGRVAPWLADGWELSAEGERPSARIRLREGMRWHDGEALTAEDVAFTYALLADVTRGRQGDRTETATENDAPVSAPRFRGRSSLVAGARATDERTVEVQFVDCNPAVATRAFTVPVLPEHVWRERATAASVGGVDIGPVPEVVVTDNVPPVGSGPFAFERNVPGDRLVLERFEDHFLAGDPPAELPGQVDGIPPYDRIDVTVVGTDETAVSMVARGDADATGTAVSAATIPRIGRSDGVDLVVDRSASPYVVGYNARRPPLTNPRFRNTLGRLIDQEWLVAEVFDRYARPAATPLAGTDVVPADLEWDDGHPVTPFLGADGSVDVEAARAAFRDAGYEYDGETLVERT